MSKSDDKVDEGNLQAQFEPTLPFRIAKMQVRQQSYDEGFAAGRAQGRAEGYLAARKEVAAYINKLFSSESDVDRSEE